MGSKIKEVLQRLKETNRYFYVHEKSLEQFTQ